MLLYFQVRLFGVNCRCLRKTKTYSIVLMLGFNICLTIDLLRYELVSYLGTTILNLLEFAFKYASIIALSKFYISRSGEIMKRCEKKKVQRRLKCAVILAFLLLLLITIFKAEIYLQIYGGDPTTDEYIDYAFHKCHHKSQIVSHAFWMISNYVLLALGYKIKNLVVNHN